MDVANAIQAAAEHHRAGRLREAERIYRDVLGVEPGNAEALHLLGVLLGQAGNAEGAAGLIERALKAQPSNVQFLRNLASAYGALNRPADAVRCYRAVLEQLPDSAETCAGLGDALYALGCIEEAEASYRRALALAPDRAEIYNNLGTLLANQRRTGEAERCYREGLARAPASALLHYNLGNMHRDAGRLAEAERCYREAIALQPTMFEGQYNLACTLKNLGRLEDANLAFMRALELRPSSAEAHNNRGTVLYDLGRLAEAEACYLQAIAQRPDHALAHNNLGNVLREAGCHDEAERCYAQAISLRPDLADAYNHHANSLLDLGRLEEAESSYRRGLELDPRNPRAHSNLLLFLNYVPGLGAADLCVEHQKFGRQFGESTGARQYANRPDPERRLRVGYVSGDFRVHSVAIFIEPILANHDRRAFEVFCYHNFPRSDAATLRLKSHADHWRDVHVVGDEALATLIRNDAIDILVDLSGHTANNRLPVFGRKPAPVQAIYLGYPATSGLAAIDYRITDSVVDPVVREYEWHAERLVRLPHAMWCYRPDDSLPVVAPLPSLRGGGVTFGSFNYFAKLNRDVIALWAQLLGRLPDSRLIVTRLPGKETEDELKGRFEGAGIAPDRLELHGIVPRARLVELFARTDIALDPFPYGGTTTTCDVLWMGIPVVTLTGETSASRSGASLLRAVGLDELVAHSARDYVAITTCLASDPKRLSELRQGLRTRMEYSPLTNAPRFTRDLEAAYRTMWVGWCSRPPA